MPPLPSLSYSLTYFLISHINLWILCWNTSVAWTVVKPNVNLFYFFNVAKIHSILHCLNSDTSNTTTFSHLKCLHSTQKNEFLLTTLFKNEQYISKFSETLISKVNVRIKFSQWEKSELKKIPFCFLLFFGRKQRIFSPFWVDWI